MSDDSFSPYIGSDQKVREFSFRAILFGLMFGFFFATANGYLALKIGTTISASIPAAILAMGVLKILFKDSTILEHNLVQTIASVGEALAAGLIFTIPALILLGDSPPVSRIFLLSLLGGILGILFMIPMRRFIIIEEHKKLPFPEGTACAEILKSGERGIRSSIMAGWGFLASLGFRTCSGLLFLWQETPSWTLRFFQSTKFSLDTTPALLGVGYIIGPKISKVVFAGGLAAWGVIIPLIKLFGHGQTPIYPATLSISDMSADMIWDSYIRLIGTGALAVGGLASLLKVFPLLIKTIRMSFQELKRGLHTPEHLPRVEKDISMSWLILGSLAIILTLWLYPGFPMNLFTIVLLVVLGFFFVCITSITVGLIGSTSNPVSGMIITTLLITCISFVLLGWTEKIYLISAITMGTVACCAITMAATTAQDLKSGFILGATPRAQQIAEILGVVIPSLSLGYTIYILNQAYHIGSPIIPAPQASLMAMIANGIITGDLSYELVAVGALIGIMVGIFEIPILPFALGVYLPLSLSSAIMVGAIFRAYVDKSSTDTEPQQRGILFASGMIGGDACMGILLALLTILGVLNPNKAALLPGWIGLVAYLLLGTAMAYSAVKKR